METLQAIGRRAIDREDENEARERSARYAAEGDHRAFTMEDHRAEQDRQAAQQWLAPYRPSITAADVDAIRHGGMPDHRSISVGALLNDTRRTVKSTTRGFSRDDRESLAIDATLLILQWTSQGADRFPLGADGAAPYRRDWLEPERPRRLTRGAMRALRAAVKQAAETLQRSAVARATETELATEDVALGRIAETEQVRTELAAAERETILPDVDAPAILADLLGVSEAGARSLLYRAFHMSADDAAEQWKVARASVSQIVSKGSRDVRGAYPDPGDLMDALAAAAPKLRARLAQEAIAALMDWRDGWHSADDAMPAVRDWRSAVAEQAPERRALEVAAARAMRRHSGRWNPDLAAEHAEQVRRLYGAEQVRAKRTAAIRGLGNGADPSGEHGNGAASATGAELAARYAADARKVQSLLAWQAPSEDLAERRDARVAILRRRMATTRRAMVTAAPAERAPMVDAEHAERYCAMVFALWARDLARLAQGWHAR